MGALTMLGIVIQILILIVLLVCAECGASTFLVSLASAFCRGGIQAPNGEQMHLSEAAQLAGVELCLDWEPGLPCFPASPCAC